MFGKSFIVAVILALIILTQGFNEGTDLELERGVMFINYSVENTMTLSESDQHARKIKQYEEYLLQENTEKYIEYIHINEDIYTPHQTEIMRYSDFFSRGYREQSMLPIQPIKYLWIENDEKMVLSGIAEEKGVSAINNYFEQHNTPLAGYGEVFIRVSQEYQLDWRLLPSIAFKESTGGKFLFRPYNPFGWGRASFDSFEEAIEIVGKNLAGENPNTAGFYKDKSIERKLHYYNSELDRYTEIIFWIMRDIEKYTHYLEGP